ncbi:MAG: hypothetical protein DRJ26_03355, partial [Candidatus Methanomethylicota archaeon]
MKVRFILAFTLILFLLSSFNVSISFTSQFEVEGNEDLLSVRKSAYYAIEYDPITNNTSATYTSILEVENSGTKPITATLVDFALDINSSTIQLLPETPPYSSLSSIGPITQLTWVSSFQPGITYIKYTAEA